MGEAREYVGEVTEEMKKVTWPDWPQLRNATFVVLIFVLIVVGIIWGMDIVVRFVLDIIMGVFAG